MDGEHGFTPSPKTRQPRIADIQAVVCARYGLSVDEMKSPCRKHRVAFPRQYAEWLTRKLTRASYPQIARAFRREGDKPRHHTVVIYSVRKVDAWASANPGLAGNLLDMTRDIEQITVLRAIFSPAPPLRIWQPPKRPRRRKLRAVEVLDRDWLTLGELEHA